MKNKWMISLVILLLITSTTFCAILFDCSNTILSTEKNKVNCIDYNCTKK